MSLDWSRRPSPRLINEGDTSIVDDWYDEGAFVKDAARVFAQILSPTLEHVHLLIADHFPRAWDMFRVIHSHSGVDIRRYDTVSTSRSPTFEPGASFHVKYV